MKGPTPEQHDGTGLRIGIVHARWNADIIDPLVEGTRAKLLACGVPAGNIVVESVPGSWELPIGVQRYVFLLSSFSTCGGGVGGRVCC